MLIITIFLPCVSYLQHYFHYFTQNGFLIISNFLYNIKFKLCHLDDNHFNKISNMFKKNNLIIILSLIFLVSCAIPEALKPKKVDPSIPVNEMKEQERTLKKEEVSV